MDKVEKEKIVAILSDAFPGTKIDDNFFANINSKIIGKEFWNSYTPLRKAIKMDRNDLVDILISLGADVNEEYLFDSSLKNIDIFRALLHAGAIPITKKHNLYIKLLEEYFIRNIDIDYVMDLFKLIMVYGGDINYDNGYSYTNLALFFVKSTFWKNYIDWYRMTLFLLENGLNISRMGYPILINLIKHYVSNQRFPLGEKHLYTLKIFKLYIEYCADLNITKNGKSALYLSMSNFSGSTDLDLQDFIKLLLIAGAKFDEAEKQKCIPWLIVYGKPSIINFLLDMSLIKPEEYKFYFDKYSNVTINDLHEPINLSNDTEALTKIIRSLYRNTAFQYAVFNGDQYYQDEYRPDYDDDDKIIYPTNPFAVQYVINMSNKYSPSQKVITDTGCKKCTLINIAGEYFDDDGRGENNSLIDLPMISPISFNIPITLNWFVDVLYRIKSNKWDTNYEMFISVKRVEINKDILEIYLNFDHGS